MSLQWNNPTVLLPKRDTRTGFTDWSINVLITDSEFVHTAYYDHTCGVWYIYDVFEENQIYDYDEFDDTMIMWSYMPELPTRVDSNTAKIDGE